jgi:hypothetical protein
VAALLGDRVVRAASVAGLAPYDALGDDYFTGMDPQNVTETGWALEEDGEDRLAAEYVRIDREERRRVAEDPAMMLAEFELADADREVLGRSDWAQVRRDGAVEQNRNGVWGWVDDSLAVRPLLRLAPPAAVHARREFRLGRRLASMSHHRCCFRGNGPSTLMTGPERARTRRRYAQVCTNLCKSSAGARRIRQRFRPELTFRTAAQRPSGHPKPGPGAGGARIAE